MHQKKVESVCTRGRWRVCTPQEGGESVLHRKVESVYTTGRWRVCTPQEGGECKERAESDWWSGPSIHVTAGKKTDTMSRWYRTVYIP